MFDKEAITALQQSAAITQARDSLEASTKTNDTVALPSDFKLCDLEKFLPNRRRMRGTMETSSIRDFASYAAKNKELGAVVFVNSKLMTANAVLNLGAPSVPGHADNTAKFKPHASAAYLALLRVADGQALDQQRVAEFLEDWAHMIECYHEGDRLTNGKAVAAVRNITIEGLRKVEASEQQLSASKSVLEQVTASSKDTLPTHIYFNCIPYQEFEERSFVMRLGIRTSDKPAITLRIINREHHDEEMANELRQLAIDAFEFVKSGMPVLVGEYSANS